MFDRKSPVAIQRGKRIQAEQSAASKRKRDLFAYSKDNVVGEFILFARFCDCILLLIDLKGIVSIRMARSGELRVSLKKIKILQKLFQKLNGILSSDRYKIYPNRAKISIKQHVQL